MNPIEFQHIFDQSDDVIALFDMELRYVAVNIRYCRFWGVERDDILGVDVSEVVGDDDDGRIIRKYMQQCLTGKCVRFEQWFDFPGVGRRYMDGSYATHQNESGEVTGVLLISRDATERKRLEENAQSERDRFDTILSAIDVGLILFDTDMKIEWVNRAMQETYPSGDPRKMLCHDFFKRSGDECEGCPARKTLRSGRMHSKEFFLPGTSRWRSFTTVPIHDDAGQLIKVVGYDVDITDQKEFLEALEAREAELASISRSSRVGIGLVKDRVFMQANDFFFDMIGYDREEVIGQSSRMVYDSAEEYRRVGEVIYRAFHGKDVVASEAQWVRKDGTPLDVLITITPMNPERPEEGATFVAMDITEHKRAEEAIRESERRFRKIFEEVEVIAVQGYDKDRKVVYWNPASEQLYGYTRDEAMGNQLEDLIIPDPMKEDVIRFHAEWINGGQPIPPGELELKRKSGETVPVYSSHVMQETALGEKIMYCVDVDMREFKRIRARLVNAKEEAEAANKAKSEFLANMSHEIRTPLNGIQGMLSLLIRSGLEGEQREFAEASLESAVRLNRLLSDILDISRVEAGKLAVHEEPFDLPELVKHVCELFRLSTEEAGIDLVRRVEDDLPHEVVGDSARLQQILTNLVGNALKYTDSGGIRVEVSRLTPLEEGSERILFSVFDTGIGIDRETLDTLFEPFTQGSSGYARQYQGAGLGLSICKRLVDLMGGNMSVESTPGEGSAFHVVLPFKTAVSHAATEVPLFEQRPEDRPALRILLAEDDKVNRIVGLRLLESMGCTVEVATDGQEALDMLRDKSFDAIFMDVQMPRMDGLQAADAIRDGKAGEDRRNVPIFAMTAYTMAGDRERLLQRGLDGYIPKPIEIEDIASMLDLASERT